MLALQILKMLQKISRQLEEVATAQQEIKEEILLLHEEFAEFQANTLRRLEEQVIRAGADRILN